MNFPKLRVNGARAAPEPLQVPDPCLRVSSVSNGEQTLSQCRRTALPTANGPFDSHYVCRRVRRDFTRRIRAKMFRGTRRRHTTRPPPSRSLFAPANPTVKNNAADRGRCRKNAFAANSVTTTSRTGTRRYSRIGGGINLLLLLKVGETKPDGRGATARVSTLKNSNRPR